VFLYIYSFLTFLFFLLFFPFIVILSFKSKYRRSLPARFWLWRNTPLKPYGVWFHVCSFGEARAVKPLVETVDTETLRMTTTTQTGMSVIKSYTPQSRYLPFEPLLWFWMRPQKVLVVFEAELWYLLFALAKRKGAHTMLVNARISERSYPKYERFVWFYRRLFAHVDEVFAQSEADKKRLEALGAKNITVTGNIKLAQLPEVTRMYDKPSLLTVCAASTHEGEEELILEAFAALKRNEPEAVLLLVPRHPERFDEVARILGTFASRYDWKTARFAREGMANDADVILVDAMGELVNCYAISDVVILGGSFVPVGGHNAAEAAQFGCRIISGEHIFNQRDIFGAIEGIRIVPSEALVDTLINAASLPRTRITGKSDIETLYRAIARAAGEGAE
jgi:3-deoxy-D-manno-octulosonic-acid transferase